MHDTAPSCPHCGFVQPVQTKISKSSLWMPSIAGTIATLCLLNWLALPDWNKDVSNGLWIFSVLAIVFGTLTIQQKRKGKIVAIISIVIAVVTILILIDRL